MKTTTIRVPLETRDRLNALARRRGTAASELIAELVQQADDSALLADAERSWNDIGSSAEALARYRAESDSLELFEAPLPEA
jgi:predicted DNA-binding protein